jgi:FKBP-type peptidyl-prolyl cis-trans isomerase
MRARYFVVFAALCAVAAACENDPIGPQCEEITTTRATTRGDTVVTASGLRYLEPRAGTGAALEACKAVSLRYIARLENGTVIDSLRTGDALTFVLGRDGERFIAGFEEGLLGVMAGGERRLIIPPALGYGAEPQIDQRTGQVVIPGSSTLIFDIRVLQVEAP